MASHILHTYIGQKAAYVFSIKDSKIITTQAFSNKSDTLLRLQIDNP